MAEIDDNLKKFYSKGKIDTSRVMYFLSNGGATSLNQQIFTENGQIDKSCLEKIITLNFSVTKEDKEAMVSNLEERIKYCLIEFTKSQSKLMKITKEGTPSSNSSEYNVRSNNITNINEGNYSLVNQSDNIICIFKTKQPTNSMELSLDLTTLNLFISLQQKASAGFGGSPKLVNYIFPPVDQIEYKNIFEESEYTKGDEVSDWLDLVISTRFDPRPNSSKGSIHSNRYMNIKQKEIFKDSKETKLYKKYYGENSELPHFHFYQQRITLEYGNNYSLAISAANLSKYLQDLSDPQKQDLRKYDLGMPFLSIVSSGGINGPSMLKLIDSATENVIDDEKAKDIVNDAIQNFQNEIYEIENSKISNFSKNALILSGYFNFIDKTSAYVNEDFQIMLANFVLGSNLFMESPYCRSEAEAIKENVNKNSGNLKLDS